jgi:hypothetical protein
LCSWSSPWVRTDADNKHFIRVNSLAAPQIFWHHFPPSKELQEFFVKLEPSEAEGRGDGRKGGDAEGRRSHQDADLDSENTLAMDISE